jgi:threonine/homoserine/homoserine lactone efflux protein
MDSQFIAFLGIAILVIITLGPNMALITKNALSGRRHGIVTALGVCLGQLVWIAASSAGVAALLVASEPLFNAVKLAGAAYLVLIGAQALISAVRSKHSQTNPEGSGPDKRGVTPRAAFRQGLISNLGNSKMAVFYSSLLPQFAPAGETSFIALFVHGAMFCSMAIFWLLGYAIAIARAGDFLRRPRVGRTIESVTGAVLIALGLRLATERR